MGEVDLSSLRVPFLFLSSGCDSHSQAGSTMECSYGTCVADDISSSSSYREKIKSDAELEKMRTKYHNYCSKSKSNNIISCPKDIKAKNLKVKWLNDFFKKIRKKSKKKKTKKRHRTAKSRYKKRKSKNGKKSKKKKSKLNKYQFYVGQ